MYPSVLLVGAGGMALEYAKVLHGLGTMFAVAGRGKVSAEAFEKKTGVSVCTGGVGKYIDRMQKPPTHGIVAVGIEQLGKTTLQLLGSGVKKILVEKPGGMTKEELVEVDTLATEKGASVYIAYNRRFFASVLAALDIITQDGGVTSFSFEFTEWGHKIEKLEKAPGVKDIWFLANSSHVVDMAFYLGGRPVKISCYTGGRLKWHPSASVFSGAGVTDIGALFSYQANWDAPGRWALEVCTRVHRLIFRPLEKLQVQNKGSIAVEEVEIDDLLDIQYKPGLHRQVSEFIRGEGGFVCTLAEQLRLMDTYSKMAHY